jgi:hypothetical protein
MRAKQEVRQSIWLSMFDVKRHNPTVCVGDVKMLYQLTLGLKMDAVRDVRLSTNPFHI